MNMLVKILPKNELRKRAKILYMSDYRTTCDCGSVKIQDVTLFCEDKAGPFSVPLCRCLLCNALFPGEEERAIALFERFMEGTL